MQQRKLTVYLLEFCGQIHMNGHTTEFNDCKIYYLDSKKGRVYEEWLISHLEESQDTTPSYLIGTSQRSIVGTERKYFADAQNFGKLFSDVDVQVTKLGDL
jgi:hypothetical protein